MDTERVTPWEAHEAAQGNDGLFAAFCLLPGPLMAAYLVLALLCDWWPYVT